MYVAESLENVKCTVYLTHCVIQCTFILFNMNVWGKGVYCYAIRNNKKMYK